MATNEYRIELNPSANPEEVETIGEEIVATARPSPTDLNNDHLHQLIAFLKANLTSTFPFALILILKAFYEHSAGASLYLGTFVSFVALRRHSYGGVLLGEYLSRQYRFGSAGCVEICATPLAGRSSDHHSQSFSSPVLVSLSAREILSVLDLRQAQLYQMGFVDVALGDLFDILHCQVSER